MADFRDVFFSSDEVLTRGTTSAQDFYFKVNAEELFKRIQITYSQNDKIILQKNKEDLQFSTLLDDNEEPVYLASFTMTQEESNMFNCKNSKYVYMQVRVLTYGGDAFAYKKMQLLLKDVLDDEVLI